MRETQIKAVGAAVSRRNLLEFGFASGVAAAATLSMPAIVRAQGKQRYLKPLVAGLNSKVGDPSYESIARISKILKEKYDVELEIQVHPTSVLGNDLAQLESVQTGFIDITSNVTAQFGQYSKAFTFVDLPYAVTSWDMGERLFASDLWKEQAAKFEAESGLVPLPPVGAGGFRLLWNSRRATPDPAAVKGLKYRTTQSLAEIALIKGWGGNPTPLPWTETYNGLKNGLVDGMHVQPIWTYSFNMFEVLKYATEVGATFAVQFQVINKNSLASMPPPIRQRFLMAAADAAKEANEMDRKLESEFRQKLIDKKMEIYKPSAAELKTWQSTGEQLWPEYGKGVDKSVIDRMVALR
jgi:TRAP-type C4-dicarboxylate transport system substrate-binding protein